MLCPVCLADIVETDAGAVCDHEFYNTTVMCPMSSRPMFRWTQPTTREAVAGRSMGYCELRCGAAATNMHHRVNASQGGWWAPANILHLCGSGTTGDHGYYTHEPQLAYDLGISVRRGDDPAKIPVQTITGDLLWLTDRVAPPLPKWCQ